MSMPKPMPITGSVLDWALAQKKLSRQEAAERLDVAMGDLDGWISDAAAPNK